MNAEINLEDYTVVVNDEGCVIVEDNMVLLENIITQGKQLVRTAYSEVADYFNISNITNEEVKEHSPVENNPTYNRDFLHDDLSSKSIKWGVGETKCLLHLYFKYIDNVGPNKQFRLKKSLWCFIANEINKKYNFAYNGCQVETRYKCVIKRTKKAIDGNNKSGSVLEETDYDCEIEEIIKLDDSLVPEYTLSAGKMKSKNLCTTHASTSVDSSSNASNDVMGSPRKELNTSSAGQTDENLFIHKGRKRRTTQERMFDAFMGKLEEQK